MMFSGQSSTLSLTKRFTWFVLLCLVLNSTYATHKGKDEVKKTNQVYLYRLLNWCVTGRGEYPLNVWPLSQFKPILQMTYKSPEQFEKSNEEKIKEVYGNTNNPFDSYDLEFHTIKCNQMPAHLGAPDTFLQRMHIMFKPKDPNVPSPHFQGLLIQAVHAPFGLGFPFGVFDVDQEFECSDCKHSHYSRIIGCIARPDMEPMHPTVAAFHYKLRGKDENRAVDADKDKILDYGYQNELHWNFKWANLPCSSSRLVEFWVLMVVDFEKRAWAVKKFGPYSLFHDTEAPFSNYSNPRKESLTTTANIPDNNIYQSGLPTPIFPACFPKHYPEPLKINSLGRPRSCFRNLLSYDADKCESWEVKLRKKAAQSGTAITASIPGAPVPNDLRENKMMCDSNKIQAIPDISSTSTRVRFVGDFDAKCIRRYPGDLFNSINNRNKRQPYKVCPEWQGKYVCQGKNDETHYDMEPEDGVQGSPGRSFPFSHCNECKPVTEEVTKPPNDKEPFFKRTEHGTLMIYAFFFFNPVSLNVARFYKETLHEKQCKGWRLWLVIHVGFAAMSSIIAYIGYTFPSFKEIDLHIALGYGALIGISSGIITGWFRHKNNILQVLMFYVHALSGYVGWALAIASMAIAPGISKYARFISYAASGICLAAMGIMTFHICVVDSSIGMRPSRSHIPIIEIRFDDIVPPKSKFRKIFLYVYIFIQFVICFGMLVL